MYVRNGRIRAAEVSFRDFVLSNTKVIISVDLALGLV